MTPQQLRVNRVRRLLDHRQRAYQQAAKARRDGVHDLWASSREQAATKFAAIRQAAMKQAALDEAKYQTKNRIAEQARDDFWEKLEAEQATKRHIEDRDTDALLRQRSIDRRNREIFWVLLCLVGVFLTLALRAFGVW